MALQIDQLLQSLQDGDESAGDQLFALLYDEFKSKAHLVLRMGHRQTICTTELVNETWLRLRGQFHSATSRRHYCNLAARAMRQVLVDRARSRYADKRGGASSGELSRDVSANAPLLAAEEAEAVIADNPFELLQLDQVLQALATIDPELAQLAQWHIFAGLSIADIAALQNVNERTMFRKWRTARMALMQLMADAPVLPT